MGPKNCDIGKDIGFINSPQKLKGHIARFASENNFEKVRVCWGHNIMNVDNGPISFDVVVSVK